MELSHQRLILESCFTALFRSGESKESLQGANTGIFVGCCNADFITGNAGQDNLSGYSATGSAFSIMANRMSYALGLTGPSMVIDTACSSSLVSLHVACSLLREGLCTAAVVSGVNLLLLPESFIAACKAGMLSPTGIAREPGFRLTLYLYNRYVSRCFLSCSSIKQ